MVGKTALLPYVWCATDKVQTFSKARERAGGLGETSVPSLLRRVASAFQLGHSPIRSGSAGRCLLATVLLGNATGLKPDLLARIFGTIAGSCTLSDAHPTSSSRA